MGERRAAYRRRPDADLCMRVLHLNTHASGGSYEYATLLSHGLLERGIESRVLCKNYASAEPGSHLLDRAIRRFYVSCSLEPWHGTRRLLCPPPPQKLQGADVVHLHTVADWFDIPSWMNSLPNNISVVVTLHDMWHFTGGCFLYRGCNRYSDSCTPCPILKPPFNHVLARDEQKRKLRAYRERQVKFVANSRWLGELAEKSRTVRACGGVRVIPPGIDTTVFTPHDKNLCRKELGLPAEAFVIATGGASLTDTNKNVPWLLEQLSHLPDLGSIILLAFGEGAVPVPDSLNVRFAGGIEDRGELGQLFAAADVFVSASLMETYGLTLVEAMACGTPVVAFRVGGIPEAAPDGQGAILCEAQDAAALIEAITRLRNSPQLRQRLGNVAHQTTHVRNAPGPFANRFTELYRQCVHTARTASDNPSVLST
jgi:glycosyltransferase involved in cell wall biosynthesis